MNFILGLIIGSFLNVCIYRIPKKQSIIYPSSYCIHCKHKLNFLDLIPVISYILLKGKCRYCNNPINIQYPLVEIINLVLYLIILYIFGFTYKFFSYAFFASFLLTIFFIDLNNKTIPNKITLTGFIFILVFKILESIFYNSFEPLLQSFLGLLVGSLPLLIITILTNGIGLGDIKLMAVIGMWLGFKLTYLTLLIGIISAGLTGLILIFININYRKAYIPFAPFLTTAAFVSLIQSAINISL